MSWLGWALLSALFAGMTAILAKVGVRGIDSNLATAIRTVVILVFAWSLALVTKSQALADIPRRAWLFLVLSGLATGLSRRWSIARNSRSLWRAGVADNKSNRSARWQSET